MCVCLFVLNRRCFGNPPPFACWFGWNTSEVAGRHGRLALAFCDTQAGGFSLL
jgi:hypothetical protein